MIIYQLVNNVNKKIYIGQTKLDLNERIKSHVKISQLKKPAAVIHRAIKKYGIENFSYHILEECKSQDELNKKEIEYISRVGTRVPVGYNLARGGMCSNNFENHPDIDAIRKRISEGTKKGQAKAGYTWLKNRSGKNNPMYGRKHTKETREKMSRNRKGKLTGDSNPMRKPEICKKQHLVDVRNSEYKKKHLDN